MDKHMCTSKYNTRDSISIHNDFAEPMRKLLSHNVFRHIVNVTFDVS